MNWVVEASSSGTYELPPSGTHGAVLVGLVDLGRQWVEYGDQPGKVTPQILLIWQLPDSDNKELVSKIFTMSLNQKAGLRKLISGWRGKDLADGERFDLSKLVGQKAMLSISHQSRGEKVSYKIEAVSAVPKGMTVAKPDHKPVAISIGDEVPDWVPKVYGKTVQEYWDQARTDEQNTVPVATSKKITEDDEIPF